MNSLLGNSAVPQYVKVMSAAILALTYIGALVVEGATLINGQTTPAIVTFVLGTGVSYAIQALGLHAGAQLGESPSTPQGSVTLPVQATPVQVVSGPTLPTLPTEGA